MTMLLKATKKVAEMYKLRDWYTKLNAVQNGVVGTHGIIKDIVKTVGFEVLKIFPKGYFSKKIVDNSKKYADTNTSAVGNFTSVSKIVCEKDIFSSFIKVSFEGREYNAPVGYDKWLTAFTAIICSFLPKRKEYPIICIKHTRSKSAVGVRECQTIYSYSIWIQLLHARKFYRRSLRELEN